MIPNIIRSGLLSRNFERRSKDPCFVELGKVISKRLIAIDAGMFDGSLGIVCAQSDGEWCYGVAVLVGGAKVLRSCTLNPTPRKCFLSIFIQQNKDGCKELDEMKKRLKEMEDEAAALREMQAKVEKEMGAVQDPANAAANQANKEEIDSRSVFVGNGL
ncbi:hypothetical protein IFM89_009290 [Coptis chinensis]|uniref:Uncharacterized protein n=1 Tax=Coptis chinensis TaxID=261450 RepID=A0A835HY95_9MAGN|nr:hypothetical protein IFM89_009290 [Coptis chinensis]